MDYKFSEILKKRPLVFDGAMGTMLQACGVRTSCNEELCVSKPKVVTDIHRAYLEAGSDIITANTFGASSITLSDHGFGNMVESFNGAAVSLARKAADEFSTSKKPRFVAGELGPTSKLPTLWQIGFEELCAAYEEQVRAFVNNGIDLLIIATCQDPLQIKAAIVAARQVFETKKLHYPIIISVTVEKNGTMLLGTELSAVLSMIVPYRPYAFGMNCATGPEAMEEHLQLLSKKSPFHIICQPNAGMPENVDGCPQYSLKPKEFAKTLSGFAKQFGISFVGGCCGTAPDHIRELVHSISDAKPRFHFPSAVPSLASLYTAVEMDQMPRPFIVAEQTNVNGSKKFKELLLKDDYDAMADLGKEASLSAHALDVCVAYAGRDECKDLAEVIKRLATKVSCALMIDSTNVDAIQKALQFIPGRAIINSINLEDGGAKAAKILKLAIRFGAAVVALTIDENGMARKAGDKLAIAKRLIKLGRTHDFSVDDLFIDPLTFTLASGDVNLADAAIQTLDGIKKIKKEIGGVRTILGVSNISYGLPGKGRKNLTSIFLDDALKAGLDAAIINPAKINPLHTIPKEEFGLCKKLVDNDRVNGDPLVLFLKYLGNKNGVAEKKPAVITKQKSPEDTLKESIVSGKLDGLPDVVGKVLQKRKAFDIINKILLPAMQEVGKEFGCGKLALPFVLASAETMRAACDLLKKHLGTHEQTNKGTLILATVRGDVHDIGKNLVDAIISNNGFKVVNLGIRQPAQAVIEAARKYDANAIGLSGLLVSSTEVMKEDLKVFRDNGISLPVLCGGAALTKSYVEKTLSKAYGGPVHYCPDAFAGLLAMEKLSKHE